LTEQGAPRGFAGLSSLITNVSKETDQASPGQSDPSEKVESVGHTAAPSSDQKSEASPTKSSPNASPSEKTTKNTSSRASSSRNSGKTSSGQPASGGGEKKSKAGWVAFAFIAILVVIGLNQQSNQNRGTTQSDFGQSDNAPKYIDQFDQPSSSSSSNTRSQDTGSTTSNSGSLKFERPPVGFNHVHSVAEIRWCVRAGIEIETIRRLVDTNLQIDDFNRKIDDHNSRCGNFRYRVGALELAEREVNAIKSSIQASARDEFLARYLPPKSETTTTLPSQEPEQDNRINPQLPEQLARDIREAQQLLANLGYDPGPVDGLMGQKTEAAIEAFQRDHGIAADGKLTSKLLSTMRTTRWTQSRSDTPSRPAMKFEKPEFYVVRLKEDSNHEFIATTRVPHDSENICFGWRAQAIGASEAVALSETLNLPSPPLDGWPTNSEMAPGVTISVAQNNRSATLSRELPVKDGSVSNIWCVAEGDPLGNYSIDVTLDGAFFKTFHFQLYEKTTDSNRTGIPLNASLDYTGKNWECDPGYRQDGNKCVKFAVPQNASLHYSGKRWECDAGYRQQGERCSKIAIPQNASLHYSGKRWECDAGYRQQGERCSKIAIPQNASLHYSGKRWECDAGYRQQGDGCIEIVIPDNASLHYSGNRWVCDPGYQRNGDRCIRSN